MRHHERPLAQTGSNAGDSSDRDVPRAVSVCLVGEPSKDVAAALDVLTERGVLSQTLKLTFEGAGATAIDSDGRAISLLPELGPIQGGADAVWRAQSLMTGDIICMIESPPIASLTPGAVERMVDRAQTAGLVVGGPGEYADIEGWLALINEITIKPLLAGYAPRLAGLIPIPLTGLYAIDRALLGSLSISNGNVLGIDLLFRIDAASPDELIAYVPVDVSHAPMEPSSNERLANEALRVATSSYYSRRGADRTLIDDKRVQLRGLEGPQATSIEIGEKPPFRSPESLR